MNLVTRARIYISRKKTKSILLLGIFIVMCCTLMIASYIENSVSETLVQIKEDANTKVFALVQDDKLFSKDRIESIEKIEDVSFINKKATQSLFVDDFKLLYEEKKIQIPITAFEDYDKDGLFSDGSLTLLKGQLPDTKKNEVMIHETVANLNDLTLGNSLTFNHDNQEIKCTIVGIFVSGNEDLQDKKLPAHLRVENQVYTSMQALKAVNKNLEYDELYIYTKNPVELSKTENKISKLLGQQFQVSSSDVFYQQMKIPLEQTSRMISMVRIVTLGASCFIIALVLSMWIRTRIKEIAVYMSIGQSKVSIYLQIIIESLILYSVAFVLSVGVTIVISQYMFIESITYVSLPLIKQLILYLQQAGVAFVVILVAISISMYPIMKMTPQTILSRMEE